MSIAEETCEYCGVYSGMNHMINCPVDAEPVIVNTVSIPDYSSYIDQWGFKKLNTDQEKDKEKRRYLATPIPDRHLGVLPAARVTHDKLEERLVVEKVLSELHRAVTKYGPFLSPLEGQAIISEEYDEFTKAVRHEGLERAREEAVQLAAMAIQFLIDCTKSTEDIKFGRRT